MVITVILGFMLWASLRHNFVCDGCPPSGTAKYLVTSFRLDQFRHLLPVYLNFAHLFADDYDKRIADATPYPLPRGS
jgi:hypothetical protein